MTHGVKLAMLTFGLGFILGVSSSSAEGPSMIDQAARLYAKATPESFDRACKGPGATLEVTGARHKCMTSVGTRIVHFEGDKPAKVTVTKNGIRKAVIGQVNRKFGKPDSVKDVGALKMHFWFTDEVRVGVAFQRSKEKRTTMVSYGSAS